MKRILLIIPLCIAIIIFWLVTSSIRVIAPNDEFGMTGSQSAVTLEMDKEESPAPGLTDETKTSPALGFPDDMEISPEPGPSDDVDDLPEPDSSDDAELPPETELPDETELSLEMDFFDEAELSSELELQQSEPDESAIGAEEQPVSFELPVAGAAGWAAYALPLYDTMHEDAESTTKLTPGQRFTILEERGDWWRIQLGDGMTGWVENSGCFINLPDVVPSIVYDITNAYSSIMRSSGFDIPNVTWQMLYEAWEFNQRLDRYEFNVAALYPMSKKIAAVQKMALANGDTLIIFEVFRPYDTQQRVARNLRDLIDSNEIVNNAINTPPWSIGSFIATTLSNHQRGAAVDTSLGKVISQEIKIAGDLTYTRITGYEEYDMPSLIHELSPAAANFSASAYTGVAHLQSYGKNAGLVPITSEWWHFNDNDSVGIASRKGINGTFFIEIAG